MVFQLSRALLLTLCFFLPVSEDLKENFNKALENASLRFFQLKIEDEKIVEANSSASTGSISDDYNKMAELANDSEANYFLFRKEDQSKWLLISYVPDGVPVKEKMIYASAKGALKDALGHSHLEEELHTTTKDELSYDHYKGTVAPVDSRSAFEVEREEVVKNEEKTRQEQQQQVAKVKEVGSGGYHSVSIPLSSSASQAISRLKLGEINYIQLAINDAKTAVDATVAKTVTSSDLGKEINTMEPRYYVYSQDHMGVKTPVFIYCCPQKAPPKLRMVYSTTKPAIADQLTKQGLNLAPKKIEISDGADLADELKGAHQARPTATLPIKMAARGNAPDLGGTVKSTHTPTVQNQHPIFKLMDKGNMEAPTTKKKIVMPPRAAWYG